MSDTFDVAVVGAGLAGMAAAVFARNRGLSTVQVGNAGALLFSSGLFDLMAVHPVSSGRVWADPWAAVAQVARDLPGHPYARVEPGEIRAAFAELVAALEEAGLSYGPPAEANCEVVTGLGTVKSTYCLPQTMQVGATALRERMPCLLVDFVGLREFSAAAIAENLAARWPGLRALRLHFPADAAAGEVYAAHLARTLELAGARDALAAMIRPYLGTARAVGLPAVLGVRRTAAIAAELEASLGVPVFEIPTLPTSVPGLRLKDALERAVAARGVERIIHPRVVAVQTEAERFVLHLDQEVAASAPLTASAVLLATGRFMSGGLVAERDGVHEALMDLPVTQPPTRAEWHQAAMFDPRGHPLNLAGVEVDAHFRPQDRSGALVHPRLFAIGTLLGHQDWARMKCGAGVALASAWGAVAALAAPATASPGGGR